MKMFLVFERLHKQKQNVCFESFEIDAAEKFDYQVNACLLEFSEYFSRCLSYLPFVSPVRLAVNVPNTEHFCREKGTLRGKNVPLVVPSWKKK